MIGDIGICGGSILSEYFIITAAHCLQLVMNNFYIPNIQCQVFTFRWNFMVKITIRIGSICYKNGGTLHNIQKSIKHPHYNQITQDNDVALLKLEIPLRLVDKKVAIIPLASFSREAGIKAIVSGWGRTNPNDDSSNSDALQYVEVPLIDHEKCKESEDKIYSEITENMICAGYKEGGKDCKESLNFNYIR